jgi:hypothetical protein
MVTELDDGSAWRDAHAAGWGAGWAAGAVVVMRLAR